MRIKRLNMNAKKPNEGFNTDEEMVKEIGEKKFGGFEIAIKIKNDWFRSDYNDIFAASLIFSPC